MSVTSMVSGSTSRRASRACSMRESKLIDSTKRFFGRGWPRSGQGPGLGKYRRQRYLEGLQALINFVIRQLAVFLGRDDVAKVAVAAGAVAAHRDREAPERKVDAVRGRHVAGVSLLQDTVGERRSRSDRAVPVLDATARRVDREDVTALRVDAAQDEPGVVRVESAPREDVREEGGRAFRADGPVAPEPVEGNLGLQ